MARSRSKTRYRARLNPRGVLRVSAAGYGFVQTAEGEFFVPASKLAGAFDGDTVELLPLRDQRHNQHGRKHSKAGAAHGEAAGYGGSGAQGGRTISGGSAGSAGRPTARVLRVLERAHLSVIGRYEVVDPFGIVIPEDSGIPYDIFTMRSDAPQVQDGDLVRVRITEYPSRRTAATGVVEEVLGRAGAVDLSIDLIISRHKLETRFSDAAQREAAAASVDEQDALAKGYRDLRDRHIFTIDPADARDYDDAISFEQVLVRSKARPGEEPGEERRLWRLGVHIADVAHYVPWDSSLDLDARRRATSVYLVDRVLPMLPEALSCDVCSLNPGVTRRTMTVDLYLTDEAELVRSDFYPALIISKERLNYEQVQHTLDAMDEEATSEHAQASFGVSQKTRDRLPALRRLTRLLYEQRHAAGGVDFETTEAKMLLDEEGIPVDVLIRSRNDATSIIEEAMILANRAVARRIKASGMAGIYRVHDAPDHAALAEVADAIGDLPCFREVSAARFAAGDPFALQAAIEASRGTAAGELVSQLCLRAMRRAEYRAVCDAHYGLACDVYTHFTSPIRRYPDLIAHRILRAIIDEDPEAVSQQARNLSWLAEHASKMERIAEVAERESQECKMAEYLAGYIGLAFPAVISGLTSHGFYVRLENTAEGFVPLESLGREFFSFDARHHSLRGEDGKTVYQLGQSVTIAVVSADSRTRQIVFRIVDAAARARRS